jgi:hypothetical protein
MLVVYDAVLWLDRLMKIIFPTSLNKGECSTPDLDKKEIEQLPLY